MVASVVDDGEAEAVDGLIAGAVRAGGSIARPTRRALWGYSGYFADPDGHLWKVSSNKKPRRQAGSPPLRLGEESLSDIAVTLGTRNVKQTKRFCRDSLGWPVDKSLGKFVSFDLGDGSPTLALYSWGALAHDAGAAAAGSGFRGFALSCIVDSEAKVDAVLAESVSAGGEVTKPAQTAQGGSYGGSFTDVDGCPGRSQLQARGSTAVAGARLAVHQEPLEFGHGPAAVPGCWCPSWVVHSEQITCGR